MPHLRAWGRTAPRPMGPEPVLTVREGHRREKRSIAGREEPALLQLEKSPHKSSKVQSAAKNETNSVKNKAGLFFLGAGNAGGSGEPPDRRCSRDAEGQSSLSAPNTQAGTTRASLGTPAATAVLPLLSGAGARGCPSDVAAGTRPPPALTPGQPGVSIHLLPVYLLSPSSAGCPPACLSVCLLTGVWLLLALTRQGPPSPRPTCNPPFDILVRPPRMNWGQAERKA